MKLGKEIREIEPGRGLLLFTCQGCKHCGCCDDRVVPPSEQEE